MLHRFSLKYTKYSCVKSALPAEKTPRRWAHCQFSNSAYGIVASKLISMCRRAFGLTFSSHPPILNTAGDFPGGVWFWREMNVLNLFLCLCALGTAAALLLLAARFWGLDAVRLGERCLTLRKPMNLRGEPFTRRDGAAAAAWGLGTLALAYAACVLYCGIFREEVSWDAFSRAWKQYDAWHYIGLAEQGYSGYLENGRPLFVVFFPLYPWLMRLLHLLIPDYHLCGFLISGAAYVGSCCVLARLTAEEFGRGVSKMSLAFLSAYPFAFFFASLHTEGLFLLLSLCCFSSIRRHRYPLAGLFGALAALTRMQGVLLALVAFAEYCTTEHPVDKLKNRQWPELWRDLWGKLFWMAVMGTGTLVYLGLNHAVTGNCFQFTVYQRERWNQGTSFFLSSLSKLWHGFLHPSEGYEFVAWTTWGPQLVLFVFCLAALLYAVRRMPPVWTLYFVICIYLNYSLNNPLSCGRYIACAFPLPAALAIAGQRRPQAARFFLTAFALLQGVFLMAYFASRHVC